MQGEHARVSHRPHIGHLAGLGQCGPLYGVGSLSQYLRDKAGQSADFDNLFARSFKNRWLKVGEEQHIPKADIQQVAHMNIGAIDLFTGVKPYRAAGLHVQNDTGQNVACNLVDERPRQIEQARAGKRHVQCRAQGGKMDLVIPFHGAVAV